MKEESKNSNQKKPNVFDYMADKYNVNRDEFKRMMRSIIKPHVVKDKSGNPISKREITDAELAALLVIAKEYNLNLFLKEITAFFNPKTKSFETIVTIDGWIKIMLNHPLYRRHYPKYPTEKVYDDNGNIVEEKIKKIRIDKDAKEAPEWITIVIEKYETDEHGNRVKKKVIKNGVEYEEYSTVTVEHREYLSEVFRKRTFENPWLTHTNRMLEWKAMIQTIRVAFGISGIKDPDEALTTSELIEAEELANIHNNHTIMNAEEYHVEQLEQPKESFTNINDMVTNEPEPELITVEEVPEEVPEVKKKKTSSRRKKSNTLNELAPHENLRNLLGVAGIPEEAILTEYGVSTLEEIDKEDIKAKIKEIISNVL